MRASRCFPGVDEVLEDAEIEASAERVNCGGADGADTEGLQHLYDCFAEAPEDPGAQFTVRNCEDCIIVSVYVSTPASEFYEILIDDDASGDRGTAITVTRCQSLDLSSGIDCQGAEVVHECEQSAP